MRWVGGIVARSSSCSLQYKCSFIRSSRSWCHRGGHKSSVRGCRGPHNALLVAVFRNRYEQMNDRRLAIRATPHVCGAVCALRLPEEQAEGRTRRVLGSQLGALAHWISIEFVCIPVFTLHLSHVQMHTYTQIFYTHSTCKQTCMHTYMHTYILTVNTYINIHIV